MAGRNLLILGGTEEARRLASALAVSDWQVTTSLAGRTSTRANLPGQTRVGGFGGTQGLRAYIETQRIDAMIDATHPFAARISANARAAAHEAGCPLLRLERPEWQMVAGDDWRLVASVEDAVSTCPAGARLFITLGRQEMARFTLGEDLWFLARMIEAPDHPPANGEIILARPPFTYANERGLMERYNISHLVSRNSGGGQTAPKLQAARDLKLPVIMIARPPVPADISSVPDVNQAIDWLKRIS